MAPDFVARQRRLGPDLHNMETRGNLTLATNVASVGGRSSKFAMTITVTPTSQAEYVHVDVLMPQVLQQYRLQVEQDMRCSLGTMCS
jgi:hypothetical protein